VTGRGLVQRLLAGSALLLGVGAVIVTFSRAGFLALVVMGVVGLARMTRTRPIAVLAVLVLALVASRTLPQGYFERLGTITNISADTTGSAQGRWSDLGVAVGVVGRNPIAGVGLGQNALALNQERGPTWREVHNVYLQYAVDLGLPGLALFLSLYFLLFRDTIRVRRRAMRDLSLRNLAIVAGCVQIALIGFAVAAFFHPVAYQFYFFGIAGVVLAVQNVCHTTTSSPRETRQAA
jgi:O-antigen ligase